MVKLDICHVKQLHDLLIELRKNQEATQREAASKLEKKEKGEAY